MGSANMVELFGHDVLRELGRVTFAAQMGEVEVAQAVGHDLRGGLGGGDVGEVAVAAEDALLETPRTARTILQHLHVMIGFEHEDIGGADAVEYEPGGVAKVGGEAEGAGGSSDQVPNRVLGVVRDGKGFDADIADLKARAGGEKLPVDLGFELFGDIGPIGRRIFFADPLGFQRPDRGVLRVAIAIDGNAKLICQAEEAGDVIAVFVSDENGREVFRCPANGGEALADLQRRKSGVHEDARPGGLDIGAVASGPTAEDGEFNGHGKTLPAGKNPGNFFNTCGSPRGPPRKVKFDFLSHFDVNSMC